MIEILEFKPYTGSALSLKGHLKISLTKIGMEISGVALFDKGAGRWVSMPRSEYIKRDGTKGWNDILRFTDIEIFRQFQHELLAALDEYQKRGLDPEKEEDADVPF